MEYGNDNVECKWEWEMGMPIGNRQWKWKWEMGMDM